MDATLLQIFATEQGEHIARIRSLIDLLPSVEPGQRAAALDELLRRAHTLKGAARAVGLGETERVVHEMETVFVGWRKTGIVSSGDGTAPIHRALDRAEDILASALGTSASDSPPQTAAASTAGPPELVRIGTTLLDSIVRSASQLSEAEHHNAAASERIGEHADAVSEVATQYARVRGDCISYLRQHAGDAGLQPLADLLNVFDDRLPQLTTAARGIALQQERHSHTMRRLVDDVNEHARRARMIPAETVFAGYGAMVRDLARTDGKQIAYRSSGLDLQADRDVLQALRDPVMHVLRNAVSHGIEAPAERTRAGKPPVGAVTLTVEVRERRLEVTVEDDGRGLNVAALARHAVMHGAMSEAAVSSAAPETLARLIFLPGLSTASAVTSLAGRGFGLSAVAQAASDLQGDVRVQHRPGNGTAITIAVPASILTQHIVLVREGDYSWGIPSAFVRQLHRFRPSDVRVVDGVESIVLDGRPVPLVRLAALLGLPGEPGKNPERARRREYQTVILDSGDSVTALVVGSLLDAREAPVKQTGLPRAAAGWSVGAVALEDGSVAVMLSADRVLRRHDPALGATQASFQSPAAGPPKTRVLVVDDSVTTRSMERSLLEANGYEVEVAVNGAEAWSQLMANPPDLVISDVNMPQMDGFELLEKIKSETSSKHIPVILVTSLDSREEQEKGLRLGADAYIVKRKFDHRELLKVVRQIV